MIKRKEPDPNEIKEALEEFYDYYGAWDPLWDDYYLEPRVELNGPSPIVGEIWEAYDTSYELDGTPPGTEIVIVSVKDKSVTYSILTENNTPRLDTITESLSSFLEHYMYLADNYDEKNIRDIIL